LTGASGSSTNYISSASYNEQGQLTQLVNEQGNGANGLTRQWLYETNSLRLNTLKAGTTSPYTNRQSLTYGYDNNGNVTSLTDGINGGQKQCFQYNWLNRLTAAFSGNAGCTAYSANGTGPYNHTYTYIYGDTTHKPAVTATSATAVALCPSGSRRYRRQ